MAQSFNGFSSLARRVAIALVVGGALGSFGWLWWNCTHNPEVYFLPRRSPAEWIIYPAGPRGTVNARVEMATVFRRSFSVDQSPQTALLSVAGLRHYALSVNGKPETASLRRGKNWKQPDEFEVSRDLRPGKNDITVIVSNSNGPPVLWLSMTAGALRLGSDETWQASYAGAAWRQARLASKPKVAIAGSLTSGGEEPWASLRARWPVLMLFAGLSAAVYWLLSRRALLTTDYGLRTTDQGAHSAVPAPGSFIRELLPVLALSILWLALFANNLGVLPNAVGYDLDGHLEYIRYIQEHHALPQADQGWEMFQPPLYYLLGAGLLSVLGLSPGEDGGLVTLRLMGMAIGIAHFVLVWASLRLLFPGEQARQRWGLLLAGALPPLLYLSQYVSNECLAAALVSACVFLTLRMLKQERPSWKSCAGLGLCLGAALLTKSTALLAVPVLLGALLWKSWLTPHADQPHAQFGIAQLGLALAACVAVCGWHYGRLWAQYGTPFIGVWDPRLGFSWWQDDGYRTGAFYVRFGAVLAHPWFSSFTSFADGLYATLWGDGLLGGMADVAPRPPWNYDLMAVGYWLALAPLLTVLAGGAVALVSFLRRPSAEWFLMLGLAFLAVLAVVHMSLILPYQCHVKAFYALCALVPFCALGALGFDALCRAGAGVRPVLGILLGLWAANSFGALWIARSTDATLLSRIQSLMREERQPEAVTLLQRRLDSNANSSPEVEAFLAYLLIQSGDLADAAKRAQNAVQRGPAEPKAHMVLADLLARQQRLPEAIQHARRAVQLAPGSNVAQEQLASLLLRDGHAEEAVLAAREGLAVAPFSAELHSTLGGALTARGENVEGTSQLHLACAIKPTWAGPRLLLAANLANEGKLAEATQQLREALRLEPDNAEAHSRLGAALVAQHQTSEAIAQYGEALHLEPDLVEALNNLAWIRAASAQGELRNGPEAVRLAERACQVTQFKEALMVGTLGAAYAEAGRFGEAVATAKKARELALTAGQHELADKNQKLAELFSSRQPYREPEQAGSD